MAIITRYVNTASTSGGDGTTNATTGANRAYASLNAAEAGEQQDLTGNTLEILCSGTATDTSRSTFSTGWITSATSYITIKPNSSDVNIIGIYNTSLYRLEQTLAYQASVRNLSPCNHVRYEGLQAASAGNQARGIESGAAGESHVVGCIIRSVSASTSNVGIKVQSNNGKFVVVNNVVFDVLGYGIRKQLYTTSGAYFIYNNTVDGGGYGINLSSGISGNSRVFNNLLTNNSTDYVSTSTVIHDNNVTSDATGQDTGHTSKTIAYTDASGKDFSTSDSDIVGLGTDLSGDLDYAFSDDIIGEARPLGDWDIGAYQVAAAGGISVNLNLATESNTAFSISPETNLTVNIGLASESNTAFSVSPESGLTVNVGLSQETNQAFVVSPEVDLSVIIGLASESDQSFSVSPEVNISLNVGLASESNTSFSITASTETTISIGLASESSQSFSISPEVDLSVNVGLVNESDSAFSVTASSGTTISIGLATEASTAFSINPETDITVNIGLAIESDTAFNISPEIDLSVSVGLASESNQSFSVSPSSELTINLGLAEEINAALSVNIDLDLLVAVGLAEESDISFTVVSQVGGGAISCLSGYMTIKPLLSGHTIIKPSLSGNVNLH